MTTRKGLVAPLTVLCVGVALPSCQTYQRIDLKPDRSAFVIASTLPSGNAIRLFRSDVILSADTSIPEQLSFVIKDIDSLGQYMSSFSNGQIRFRLTGDTLHINSVAGYPLPKGWASTGVSLFIEQGIRDVRTPNKHLRESAQRITFPVRRKQLKKEPEAFRATIYLKPVRP